MTIKELQDRISEIEEKLKSIKCELDNSESDIHFGMSLLYSIDTGSELSGGGALLGDRLIIAHCIADLMERQPEIGMPAAMMAVRGIQKKWDNLNPDPDGSRTIEIKSNNKIQS